MLFALAAGCLLGAFVRIIAQRCNDAKRALLILSGAAFGGAVVGVFSGPVVNPAGWLDDWIGYVFADACARGFIGATVSIVIAPMGFAFRQWPIVRRRDLIAWTLYGALAGFLLAAAAGPLPISGHWRMHWLGYTWQDVVLRGNVGAVVGALAGLFVVSLRRGGPQLLEQRQR